MKRLSDRKVSNALQVAMAEGGWIIQTNNGERVLRGRASRHLLSRLRSAGLAVVQDSTGDGQ